MALIKNEIPILEYDTAQEAIIMPGHSWDYQFTKKAVMLFMNRNVRSDLNISNEESQALRRQRGR